MIHRSALPTVKADNEVHNESIIENLSKSLQYQPYMSLSSAKAVLTPAP